MASNCSIFNVNSHERQVIQLIGKAANNAADSQEFKTLIKQINTSFIITNDLIEFIQNVAKGSEKSINWLRKGLTADVVREALSELTVVSKDQLQDVVLVDLTQLDDKGDKIKPLPVDLQGVFKGYNILHTDFLKQVKSDLIRSTVADLSTKTIVDNDAVLNRNITALKNKYYKQLVSFIEGSNGEELGVDDIFTVDGKLKTHAETNLHKVLRIADNYFSNLGVAKIDKARSLGNLDVVNAFYAYTMLRGKNFDKLLKTFRGDTVESDSRLGLLTPASANKYSLSTKKAIQKGLGTDRFAHSEVRAPKAAKDFIESLYIDTLTGRKYLKYNDILYVINKALDLSNYKKVNQTVYDIVQNVHKNGIYGITELLERILRVNNSNLDIALNYSQEDIQKLRVIYDNIYDPKNKNSLRSIYAEKYGKNLVLSYNMLDNINNMLFRQNRRTYITYKSNGESLVYNKNYTMNTALKYVDQFNFELNKVEYFKSTIDKVNAKFANISQDGEVEDSSIEITLNLWDVNGTQSPVVFIVTNDGDLLTKSDKSKSIRSFLGMNSKSTTFPLNAQQLAEYIESGKIDTSKFAGNTKLTKERNAKNYIEFLKFVQYTLPGMQFLGKDLGILNLLYTQKPANYLTTLGTLAHRSLKSMLINNAYYEDSMSDTPKYQSQGLVSLLDSKEFKSLKEKNRAVSNYIDQTSEGFSITNGQSNPSYIMDLAQAAETYVGTVSGTIRNNSGTDLPVTQQQIESQRFRANISELGGVLSANIILQGQNRRLVEESDVHFDESNYNHKTKAVKDLEESEYNYSMFVNRFLEGITDMDEGYIYVQPIVYADKGTMDIHKVHTNGWTINGKKYNFSDPKLELSTIQDLVFQHIGSTYQGIYQNTLQDYRTVIKNNQQFFISRINQLPSYQTELKSNLLSYFTDTQALADVKAQLEQQIQKLDADIKKAQRLNNSTNQLDAQRAQLVQVYDNLSPIDILTFDQCAELMSIITPEEYEDMAWESGVDNVQQIHIGSKTKFTIGDGHNSKTFTGCGRNKLLQYCGEKLYGDQNVFNAFMEREKYKYIKDLMESGTVFYLTHADFKDNKTLKKAIEHFKLSDDWISYGELVLAKDSSGNNIYRIEDLVEGDMQMNPLLERYFLTDLLFRTSIRHLTVGTELGHANGYGKAVYVNGKYDEVASMEMEMSARNTSSLKRAVGETLPRSMITSGSVSTLPSVMYTAIMPDRKAPTFNISGESKNIDSQDGGDLMNPLTAILINLGLAGNEGGEDIKGLLRAINDRYGQAILYKYASFSQYNERMRNSISGEVSMLHAFKKMTDIPWHDGKPFRHKPDNVTYNEVDITKNLWGKSISFKQIVGGKDYYYKQGRRIFKVDNIIKRNGVDQYAIKLREVQYDDSGNLRTVTEVEKDVQISSLWDLYQTIGGCYSGHFVEGEFVMDDSSLHAVVGYMNNVGVVYDQKGVSRQKAASGEAYLDSSQVYQPLKYYFISSMLNQSGCKNGGNHCNKMSAWTDDSPLHTMEVRTDAWGQVQDYDHDVSVGKSVMTEFSQVMTALAAGGMMFKANEKVFKAITGYSIQQINNYLTAVEKYMNDNLNSEGKSAIYDIIGKLIVRGSSRDGSLSQALAEELKGVFKNNAQSGKTDHSNDSIHLPISSPEIFVRYVVEMASVINKLSVKRKVPGLGGVMAPSYDIFTYFQVRVNDLLGIRNEGKATQSDLLRAVYASEKNVYKDGTTVYTLSDRSKDSNVKQIIDLNQLTTSQGNYYIYTTSISVSQDGMVEEVLSKNKHSDPFNRNKQLKNVISLLSDLEVGQQVKVKNTSFISLILDAVSQNFPGYLIKQFDNKTKVYTYTKQTEWSDTQVVNSYMDTLNYFNYSGIIHETELKKLEEKTKADDLTKLTAQPVKGTAHTYTIVNPNLKTKDDLFVQDSIILADQDGRLLLDENGKPQRVTLDTYEKYTKLKSEDTYFYHDLAKSKNLQPSKAKFKAVNGKWYDLYDLPQVREVFKEREDLKGARPSQELLLKHRRILLPMLRMLDQGWVTVSKEEYDSITDPSSKTKQGNLYYLKVVDKQMEDAECVLPKIFAKQFGLREGDSLYDILEQGPEFFNQRQREIINSIDSTKTFDIAFINGDKNHRYIRFNIASNTRREEVEDAYIDIVKKKVKDQDGKERYEYRKVRVDADGTKLYTLQIAYSDSKKENTDKLQWEDYIVPLETSTGEEVFYCAKPEAAAELYSKSDFSGVKIKNTGSDSKLDTIKQFIKALNKNKIDLIDFDYSTIERGQGIKTKPQKQAIVDKTLDEITDLDTLVRLVDQKTNRRLNGNGIKIFNSFKLSLDLLVARIPAQSLQSFMKMKVVGFSDSNKNSIMVSHYQLWLQGSDYDIDKAYAMGYEFSNGGIFVGWSPYFSLVSDSNYRTSLELPLPSGNNVSYVPLSKAKDNAVDITDILNTDIFRQTIIPTTPSNFTGETLQAIKVLLDRIGEAKWFTFDSSILEQPIPGNLSKEKKKELMDLNKQTVEETVQYIRGIINEHTTYFQNAFQEGKNIPGKPSAKTVGMAYKNCISYNAQKVSSSVANILDSTAPISMDIPKEAAESSTAGGESMKMTQYSPSYISKMVKTFMVGKDGIGIAANGEKVFFSLMYYYTDAIIKGDTEKLKKMLFNKEFIFGASQVTRNLIANVNLDYIQGVDMQTLSNARKFIQDQINSLYKGEYKGREEALVDAVQEQLSIGHDQALVISALLSAATDNAKELILSKIGADTKFMNMYIYCIVLGIPFSDISKFMTSPLATFIMEMTTENMYDEYAPVTFTGDPVRPIAKLLQEGLWNNAPYVITKIMTKEQYVRCFLTGEDLPGISYHNITEVVGDAHYTQIKVKRFLDLHYKLVKARRSILSSIDATMDYTSQSGVTISNSMEETFEKVIESLPESLKEETVLINNYVRKMTNQFVDIRTGAKELTNLSTLLGLNQGIPVTLDDSLNKYVQIENIFINGIKYSKAYEGLTDEEVQYAENLEIKEHFDFDRFMSDRKYRDVCVKMFENAKHTINIFDVITSIPHIWNLYNMWHASEVGKKAMTIKYKKALEAKQAIGSAKLTKGEISKMAQVIHDAGIYNWITSQNISIPIKKGQRYLKDEKFVIADSDFNMKLNTHDGLATFKFWFESYALQSLRDNGTMDGSKNNAMQVALFNNQFIRNLVVSTEPNAFTGRRRPLITFNVDFQSISELGASRDLYNDISEDFGKLSGYMFNNISYVDWFFLYNLVANKNMYGSLRIQPIFSTLKSKTKLIDTYDKEIGDSDYNGIDNIGTMNQEDYFMAIAPAVTPGGALASNSKYVRVWNNNKKCYQLYKRQDKYDSYHEGMSEMEYYFDDYANYESGKVVVIGYKFVKDLGNSIYNSYYGFGNRSSIELFNKYGLDTTDQQQLRERLYNLFKDNLLTMYVNC